MEGADAPRQEVLLLSDAKSIEWWPQPKQLDFLDSCGAAHPFSDNEARKPLARIVGYGGAAGGGKSDSLLALAIVACFTYAGCQAAYFRRTYPELEGGGGAIMRSLQLLTSIARYDKQGHKWHFPNGSVLSFCHCKSEDDVYKYQGLQFDVIVVDEATHFTEFQVSYLLTRNRLNVAMPAPIFAMGTNPGGVGHYWFARIFEPEKPSQVRNFKFEGAEKSATCIFIPARLEDNRILEDRDPTYRQILESQPKHIRDQLLYGKWGSFTGQAFPDFDSAIHVCEPFTIPAHWKRWRSNDPGFTDPFAWYWFAVSQDGVIYIYREFTRNTADPKLIYSDQASKVSALSLVGVEIEPVASLLEQLDNNEIPKSVTIEWDEESGRYDPKREQISFTVSGMDAFVSHPETGKALLDYYREKGVDDVIRPVYGSGSRQAMKATFHEYFKPFEGPDGKLTAKLQVFSTCTKLIETLPLLITDPDRPEQVAEMRIDHWYQGAGYGLQAHHVKHTPAPKNQGAPTLEQRVSTHKEKLAKKLAKQNRGRTTWRS